jgi:hypothetical protein
MRYSFLAIDGSGRGIEVNMGVDFEAGVDLVAFRDRSAAIGRRKVGTHCTGGRVDFGL